MRSDFVSFLHCEGGWVYMWFDHMAHLGSFFVSNFLRLYYVTTGSVRDLLWALIVNSSLPYLCFCTPVTLCTCILLLYKIFLYYCLKKLYRTLSEQGISFLDCMYWIYTSYHHAWLSIKEQNEECNCYPCTSCLDRNRNLFPKRRSL